MACVGLNSVMRVALLVVLLASSCNGKVYKVGDKAGWTIIGNVDYKQWAATKTFHVGDVIVFNYNPQFHNVIQVTHAEYKTCNSSSPIAIHTAGNDTITITNHGHHFFLCGIPGHCQSGQKVDINVIRVSSLLAPTPSVASTPATMASAASDGPAPSPNDASLPIAPTKMALAMANESPVDTLHTVDDQRQLKPPRQPCYFVLSSLSDDVRKMILQAEGSTLVDDIILIHGSSYLIVCTAPTGYTAYKNEEKTKEN
ncbi:hypothetical protein V2J09_023162 [Rumex salicifolius]